MKMVISYATKLFDYILDTIRLTASFMLLVTCCYSQVEFPKTGYEGAVLYSGHELSVPDSGRDTAGILTAIKLDKQSFEKQRLLLAELIVHCPPEEIPWKQLIQMIEAGKMHPESVVFCVVTAGKALMSEEPPLELYEWLFHKLDREIDTPSGWGAIITFSASGFGVNTVLPILSSKLRDEKLEMVTFGLICETLSHSYMLTGEITFDQAANCLIAGYDSEKLSIDHKTIFWGAFDKAVPPLGLRERDFTTELRLHTLAASELSNESYPEDLRRKIFRHMKRRFPISSQAKKAAENIVNSSSVSEKFKEHVSRFFNDKL